MLVYNLLATLLICEHKPCPSERHLCWCCLDDYPAPERLVLEPAVPQHVVRLEQVDERLGNRTLY